MYFYAKMRYYEKKWQKKCVIHYDFNTEKKLITIMSNIYWTQHSSYSIKFNHFRCYGWVGFFWSNWVEESFNNRIWKEISDGILIVFPLEIGIIDCHENLFSNLETARFITKCWKNYTTFVCRSKTSTLKCLVLPTTEFPYLLWKEIDCIYSNTYIHLFQITLYWINEKNP